MRCRRLRPPCGGRASWRRRRRSRWRSRSAWRCARSTGSAGAVARLDSPASLTRSTRCGASSRRGTTARSGPRAPPAQRQRDARGGRRPVHAVPLPGRVAPRAPRDGGRVLGRRAHADPRRDGPARDARLAGAREARGDPTGRHDPRRRRRVGRRTPVRRRDRADPRARGKRRRAARAPRPAHLHLRRRAEAGSARRRSRVACCRAGRVGLVRIDRFSLGTTAAAHTAVRRSRGATAPVRSSSTSAGTPAASSPRRPGVASIFLDRGERRRVAVRREPRRLDRAAPAAGKRRICRSSSSSTGAARARPRCSPRRCTTTAARRIVGHPTYGKSLVQEIDRLATGGALKLTVASYRTPAGRDIAHGGVAPDVRTTHALHARRRPPVARLTIGRRRCPRPSRAMPATGAPSP